MISVFFLIIGIIIIGIILVILELLIFPGTTIFGIIGAGFVIVGVYLSYSKFEGNFYGNITLLSTIVIGLVITHIAFRTKTWKRASLQKAIISKVKQFDKSKITIGNIGITVSRLAPMGNIKIHNEIVEATARGEFIDQNKKVEVIKIKNNILVVKSKT